MQTCNFSKNNCWCEKTFKLRSRNKNSIETTWKSKYHPVIEVYCSNINKNVLSNREFNGPCLNLIYKDMIRFCFFPDSTVNKKSITVTSFYQCLSEFMASLISKGGLCKINIQYSTLCNNSWRVLPFYYCCKPLYSKSLWRSWMRLW